MKLMLMVKLIVNSRSPESKAHDSLPDCRSSLKPLDQLNSFHMETPYDGRMKVCLNCHGRI